MKINIAGKMIKIIPQKTIKTNIRVNPRVISVLAFGCLSLNFSENKMKKYYNFNQLKEARKFIHSIFLKICFI
jgi:hypothetical protein